MKLSSIWSADSWLKLVAFVLAVMMWFFATYKGQSEMLIEAPIEFKNTPKGFIILKQSANKVNVHVSGHDRLLKALRPINARVVVDLSKAKKGDNEFFLNRSDVVISSAIKVMRIDPTLIKFALDELATKAVPVRVPVIGIPEDGYKISTIEVIPKTVEIEGARSEIHDITLLKTETIDITGLDKDLQQTVKITTGGRNIIVKNGELTVRISIRKVQR